jgi:Rps23 Pro-64 3,4-dihydroxylase Tpa1-like proline 4-hydroxylase
MQATRIQSIEGREIRVYDGLLGQDEIMALTGMFDEGAFTRTESAREDTRAFRHWVLNIPLDAALRLPAYAPTAAGVDDFAKPRKYRAYRSYCNQASYGAVLLTHTDSRPGEQGLTALWYIAPMWDVEWGGETLFFNSKMDAEVVVSPRPGRLVIFDGSIPHAGRPPSRICHAPRYTLAYKFDIVE